MSPSVPKPTKKAPARRAWNSTAPAPSKSLPRSTKAIARTAVKKRNAKRKVSQFARCYHSRERVLFVKSLPCIVYSCTQPSENAHVTDDGSKGMGRKSGYLCIAPLCAEHHTRGDYSLHVLNARRFELMYQIDLHDRAARTQIAWQNHQGSR